MTETRLHEAIDAIVAALQGASDLTVRDGPIVSGDVGDAIYIGYDGRYEEYEEAAATGQQKWAGIGQKARDETLQITCAAVAYTGNDLTLWKPVRDTVFAMLDTVGEVLRDDPSLGLPPPAVAELWPGDYWQEPIPNGAQARLVFQIHLATRV